MFFEAHRTFLPDGWQSLTCAVTPKFPQTCLSTQLAEPPVADSKVSVPQTFWEQHPAAKKGVVCDPVTQFSKSSQFRRDGPPKIVPCRHDEKWLSSLNLHITSWSDFQSDQIYYVLVMVRISIGPNLARELLDGGGINTSAKLQCDCCDLAVSSATSDERMSARVHLSRHYAHNEDVRNTPYKS